MNAEDYEYMIDLMQNRTYDWYFGNLPREEAQKLIFMESDGSYLIRDCNQIPGSYVLMVKEKSHTNKYVISSSGSHWKIGTMEFDSVESILQRFSQVPIRQSLLTNSVPKPFYRVTKDYNTPKSLLADIELQVNEGEFVDFILRYKNMILCQEKSKSKKIGWLPLHILKQTSNDGISVQQIVFKIHNIIPFKTFATKARNPNVFDKLQLSLKEGDVLSISDVLDDGMLKATKDDGKEGFVPFNIVRLPDLKLEM